MTWEALGARFALGASPQQTWQTGCGWGQRTVLATSLGLFQPFASKPTHREVPGGAVVKNLPSMGFRGGLVIQSQPANAGSAGLTPGSGRSHIPEERLKPVSHSRRACALEPRAATLEACTPMEPVLCSKRSHRDENPTHHD